MEDVDEAEDEEEVVVLGDAGCAVMWVVAGLWAAASAAATAGMMEGMSSGCRVGNGQPGGPEEKHAGQETPLLYTPYLQWHHPGGRALLQLAQAPTQDYHSYTHALLGVVGDQVLSPNDPPVKKAREHSSAKQLWPNRDATTRFPARAWREGVLLLRAQRGCRWSRTALATPG